MTKLDEQKAIIKGPGHIAQFLRHEGYDIPDQGNFRCILPGHDDRNPSANIHVQDGVEKYHCFGCGHDLDIFALCQTLRTCGFMDALHYLAGIFGMALNESTGNNPDASTAAYITRCAQFIFTGNGKTGLDYLHGRGLSDATIKRFKIGYDHKEGGEEAGGAIIIPYGPRFFKRFINPIKTKTGNLLKGLYDTPKGTQRPVFGAEGLTTDSNNPLFIVEGEIDALSLIETGQQAIAIGGTGGWRKGIELVQQYKVRCVIPCMDRDNPGEAAQTKIEAALDGVNGCSVFKGAPKLLLPDLADGSHPKDCNEALVNDRAGFIERVRTVAAMAVNATATAKDVTGKQANGEIFGREIDGISLRRFCDIPPTKPEDEDPDALIKGYALAKGEGWIIAGEPGVGKSSFIIQFALFAAAGKKFFGWEFSRPLRVFYLQTELQMRKLEQSRNSILSMMEEWGWTQEEMDLATNNLFFDDLMIGNTCDNVAAYLIKVFKISPFDLLFIDPLLTFIEDDPSLVKPMKELLYKNVNAAMGGKAGTGADGTPIKFAAIISHHTSKPKFERGQRVDRGQFNAAGSFAINAWARFQLNLMHHTGLVYKLTAAKNPECAPWRSDDGSFIDHLMIKRAERGQRYWTQATAEEVTAAEATAKAAREARRRAAPDTSMDIPNLAAALRNLPSAISKTEARKMAYKVCEGAARGDNAFNTILENPAHYNVPYIPGKRNAGWIGGPPVLPMNGNPDGGQPAQDTGLDYDPEEMENDFDFT
jgi:hypothetical protein